MDQEQNHNKNYTAADIQRYLNREMSVQEMHALEKAALDDPFLADAIDGYAMYPDADKDKAAGDLDALQHRLNARLSGEEKNIAPVQGFSWWRVAAVVLLLAGIGAITYTLIHLNAPDKSTLARNEKVEPSPVVVPYVEPAASPIDSSPRSAADPSALNRLVVPRQKAEKNAASNAPVPRVVLQETTGYAPLSARPAEDVQAVQAEAATPPAAKAMEKSAMRGKRERDDRRAPAINNFSGKITDRTNKPVGNASVLIVNTQLLIETDSSGNFSFTLPDSIAYVLLNAPGFENTTATLRASNEDNHILLMEKEQASDNPAAELKKARLSTDSAAHSSLTEPVPGWPAFNRYIATNKRISPELKSHGEVVLSFTVNSYGRPAGITVEKPVNKILDDEAVRLLREGPAWNPVRDKNRKATVKISF